MTNFCSHMTVSPSNNSYSSKLGIGQLTNFHRFSVSNNATLSEFNWKGVNVKGGNKCPFETLKICKPVKGKHQRSMNFPVDCNKLKSSDAS